MPPNRKAHYDLDSHAPTGIASFVTPSKAASPSFHTPDATSPSSHDYWNWPAFPLKEPARHEEERTRRIKQLFSADHIMDNVVKAASDLESPQASNQNAANDEYWAF